MLSKPEPIFPSEQKILINLGERIRLARLRRGLSAETVAERSSISRMTLHRAEKGFLQWRWEPISESWWHYRCKTTSIYWQKTMCWDVASRILHCLKQEGMRVNPTSEIILRIFCGECGS